MKSFAQSGDGFDDFRLISLSDGETEIFAAFFKRKIVTSRGYNDSIPAEMAVELRFVPLSWKFYPDGIPTGGPCPGDSVRKDIFHCLECNLQTFAESLVHPF